MNREKIIKRGFVLPLSFTALLRESVNHLSTCPGVAYQPVYLYKLNLSTQLRLLF